MYDDWPGYTKAFLASHFDEYDTNKDGKLTIEEFRVSSKTAKWGWRFNLNGQCIVDDKTAAIAALVVLKRRICKAQ